MIPIVSDPKELEALRARGCVVTAWCRSTPIRYRVDLYTARTMTQEEYAIWHKNPVPVVSHEWICLALTDFRFQDAKLTLVKIMNVEEGVGT